MDSPASINRRTLLAAAGVTAASGVLSTGTAHADATVRVDPAADQGAWEGWGTSLAWWANVFGDRDDFADLFFTTKTVSYNGASLPGLGMNIARYNLGACSWNAVGSERMVASPNIPRFKQIEGFWQDWGNEDPASSAWNWNADAKQRAMLVKATQRGAISELFANSPMWWMCSNHNPSGAADGGNNLQSWNHRQHALHLAVTARRARDQWGVNFRTVDPFNEPSSNWWKADGGQEGCHIDATTQRSVIANLRTELDRLGLTGVGISASDETNYDLARTTWNSFDSATKGRVRQVNVHGYQGLERSPRSARQRRAGLGQGALELRARRLRRQRHDDGPLPADGLPLAQADGLVLLAGHGPDGRLGHDPVRRQRGPGRRGGDEALRTGPVHPAHPARACGSSTPASTTP